MKIKQTCQFCNNTINELEYHNKICIYYIYNLKYNKKISNKDIKYISEIISLFNLYKYSIDHTFNVRDIINTLIIKYYINKDNIIELLINYFKNINTKTLFYNDILLIIVSLTNYSKDDIINILNAYRICYKNLD